MFGVRTTGKTLAQFYRHHNVTYKCTKKAYRKAIANRSELEEERIQFSVVLANLIEQDKPLIYLDESSFIN